MNAFRQGDLGGVVADGKMANNRLTSGSRGARRRRRRDIKMPGDTRSRCSLQRNGRGSRTRSRRCAFEQRDTATIATAVQRACTEDPDFCKRPNGRAAVEALLGDKARESVVTRARTQRRSTLVDRRRAVAGPGAECPARRRSSSSRRGSSCRTQEAELRQAVGTGSARRRAFLLGRRARAGHGPAAHIIDQVAAFDSRSGASVEFDLQADGTNSLAVDTGGFAIRNENNFGRALDEIQRDAGTYYVVGYTPAKETLRRQVPRDLGEGDATRREGPRPARVPCDSNRPLFCSSAAVPPKSAAAGAASAAGVAETKADLVTREVPVVPMATAPRRRNYPSFRFHPDCSPSPRRPPSRSQARRRRLRARATPVATAVRTRIDAGKMVLELRSASAGGGTSAGFGETSSALNPPNLAGRPTRRGTSRRRRASLARPRRPRTRGRGSSTRWGCRSSRCGAIRRPPRPGSACGATSRSSSRSTSASRTPTGSSTRKGRR